MSKSPCVCGHAYERHDPELGCPVGWELEGAGDWLPAGCQCDRYVSSSSDGFAATKVKISLDDPETRAVWETAQRAKAEVAAWPAWKRGDAPTIHDLKTWPEPFDAIATGRKLHEIRKADRSFAVGDTLRLREWTPDWDGGGAYTGRIATAWVTYITRGPEWGVPEGMVVMSIDVREVGWAASAPAPGVGR